MEKDPISDATLYDLIDLARLGGSARNGQPWQYMIANKPEICEKIFPYLDFSYKSLASLEHSVTILF